ncbi:hypothetical protein [Deinococcus sp. QL22]|uniref:hypothetical protein n=1 Tax=Deinococcus sp. QL22 TaxID=2939437 RepID=UPI002017AA7F|nr:hypothetical protein [Deinococcus sp. QL22]UQN05576.1 hypothetical protein M1R55_11930 [Deinococcus sp. QL22]
MEEDLVRFASNEIINYVNAQPESADTVEDIHQWWIQWPGTPEPVAITLAALGQLERDGFMQMVPIANRNTWRRRREDSEREE